MVTDLEGFGLGLLLKELVEEKRGNVVYAR